jgi:uncharacterized membrane protein (DUF4010 family)
LPDTLINLALALAAGLIVGAERGWQERTGDEGSRLAGIRTFGLIGLLGGFWELLTAGNAVAFGCGFLALGIIVAAAHYAEAKADRDYGITTIVATLITFILGALAVRGEGSTALAGAAVVATILNLKPTLHGWLKRIEPAEINAALKLLLISLVILPILPHRGYGPWEALNPYALWSFVILVAGISFAAYAAIKIAGATRGVLLTGLLGGLVSSTATTLQLARLANTSPQPDIFAAGTLVASATMFVRILIIATLINGDLWNGLWLPMLVMAAPLAVTALILARKSGTLDGAELQLRNPVELGQAIRFGLLLAGILIVSKGAQKLWGSGGIYLVAGVAGLADVDAISISAARMAGAELPYEKAALAIAIAAMVNTATKGALAASVGGRGLGIRVLVPVAVAVVVGGIVALAK